MLMAIKGPFALYTDMIIDYTIFYYVVIALGGFKIIFDNITSFPSTVSKNLTIEIYNLVQTMFRKVGVLNIYI